MRMQITRTQARWSPACQFAELIAEHLEADEPAQKPGLSQQARHGMLWYQVGFTRMMNAQLVRADSAYRRVLRIATANGFTSLEQKCHGHLTLLGVFLGTVNHEKLPGAGVTLGSSSVPESKNLEDIHLATEWFSALWRLDQAALATLVNGRGPDTGLAKYGPFSSLCRSCTSCCSIVRCSPNNKLLGRSAR